MGDTPPLNKGLNFVYEYNPLATKGPVVTLAAEEVTPLTPDITAHVPLANMSSLFQFENLNIDNSTSTVDDSILTGTNNVNSNSRSLRLDFTPLEQVILGIEHKLGQNLQGTFQDDVSANVRRLLSFDSSNGVFSGESEILNKLPAAALISRDTGSLQLLTLLTDTLNSGPTYYTKNSSTSEYTAIIQLFGQATQQGMLSNANYVRIPYDTYNMGFPAYKVLFEENDYLDITVKYTVSNDYVYKIQQTLGGPILTGGTFKVGGYTFFIGPDGRLDQGNNTSQTVTALYKIRFVASSSPSVFNISNETMSTKYNTALVNLTKLYDNTGSSNTYNFNSIKSTGPFSRTSPLDLTYVPRRDPANADIANNPLLTPPVSTFFQLLKSVTDNLKLDNGSTLSSLVGTNEYLSRSVFLNGKRIPSLPYLNAYVYNTPVLSDILANPNDIGALQKTYGLATSTYLTNTAMVYNLSTGNLRSQLSNIVGFYGSVVANNDVNVGTFNNLIVLAANFDGNKPYTFTKAGTDRVKLKLQDTEEEYDLGKTLLLVPRTSDGGTVATDVNSTIPTTLFEIGSDEYTIPAVYNNSPITATPGPSLLTKLGERYNRNNAGGVIMCVPNDNVRFGAAFYDNAAKATLPGSTYALASGANTVISSTSLSSRLFLRKSGSLPITINGTGSGTKTYTITSGNFNTEDPSITVGYFTTSSNRALNKDIKWVEIPRLQPTTYAPADADIDTSVISYAYLSGATLVLKFRSTITVSTKAYFYNALLKNGSASSGTTVEIPSAGITLNGTDTKNLWIVTEREGAFTKSIVKCFANLEAASGPPPVASYAGLANLYQITYTVSGESGSETIDSIVVNGDDVTPLSGAPYSLPLDAPFLAIITKSESGTTTTYYASNKSSIHIVADAGVFSIVDSVTNEALPALDGGPLTYDSAPPSVYDDTKGLLKGNIVYGTPDENYYLVVKTVTAAPNPNSLDSGYILFQTPQPEEPIGGGDGADGPGEAGTA
jgi:hypothetical protein